jgi:acyl phosphate:glycerol-3-phosphate acyltransferase
VWLEFGLLLVAAYLVGSIPAAYLAVKWYRGVDIRKYGSGQVGGSNVFRSFSKPLGITVGLFDLFKGIIMVLIAYFLGMGIGMQVAVGLAVVVGHNWPIFLSFNAGRGLATTAGICFYLMYENDILLWAVAVFIFLALFTFVIGGSPLPTLAGVAAMPVVSAAFGKPLALTLGLTAFLLLMIVRRLTAPKTAESCTIKARALYLNRFLFDRDIKDGNTWIRRLPWDPGKKAKQNKQSKG